MKYFLIEDLYFYAYLDHVKMAETYDSVTRLDNFWTIWLQIFRQKLPEYLVTFELLWKYHVLIKTAVATFWAHFKTFGLLYIPTYGHTAHHGGKLLWTRHLPSTGEMKTRQNSALRFPVWVLSFGRNSTKAILESKVNIKMNLWNKHQIIKS